MGDEVNKDDPLRLTVGILAHVDAGKTTLSEALLYTAGVLRRLGRVDHGDAFLDTDAQERARGITIFSKQAILSTPMGEITLMDTPGHVDFSAEAERVLGILDCAVLVISGTDGVQPHTLTLWDLLSRHGIPVFIFVNKMDLAGAEKSGILSNLRDRLSRQVVDFTSSSLMEEAATGSEEALSEFLETGTLCDESVRALIREREIFPCFFGSALKLTGVEEFLNAIFKYATKPLYSGKFGARVYKIGRDQEDRRLTYLKVTGGTLKVKDLLEGYNTKGERWEEKVEQIRLYSGEKFRALDLAPAGTVCAVLGLSQTYAGEGLGMERDFEPPALSPVLSYKLILKDGYDPADVMKKLKALEEEDPELNIYWNEALGEISVRLMGQVQMEILKRRIEERFGLDVDFAPGGIVYKETIASPSEGIGHYEPLRHYAEVRLLLEPGKPGSGLVFSSSVGEDSLDRSWQRLILTHLAEKQHLGVLTGSPITDMRITLIAGRSDVKHTEGGDFREATYRAVRQGLMEAESVLLEPWYRFKLSLPRENLGRAMSDLERMGAKCEPPMEENNAIALNGTAPVAEMRDYFTAVTAYTKGEGRLSCRLSGYMPCHNSEEIIKEKNYDPEADLLNSPDSIFCAHGAGFVVPWDKVPQMAHTESPIAKKREPTEPPPSSRPTGPITRKGTLSEDKELLGIFERTYGPAKPRDFNPIPRAENSGDAGPPKKAEPIPEGPEYLLVDGYNIIYAWDELAQLAREDLSSARRVLMEILVNYRGFRKNEIILVFDAYKVKGNPGSQEVYKGIHVVYTKEAQTADAYIERATFKLGREHCVRVATSDSLEQLIILGHGAQRVSAREFKTEVEAADGKIRELVEANNRRQKPNRPLRKPLSKLAAQVREDGTKEGPSNKE